MSDWVSKIRKLSFPLRCFVALLLVTVSAFATNGLWLLVDRPISTPLFLAAILLSSWFGGIRVGVFASFISGLAIDYYYFQPFSAFGYGREEMIRLALFLAESSLMCWLIERVRAASDEIRLSREELRELTQYQQSLRETEQRRIALEIHDELGQSLTRLRMDARQLKRQIDTTKPKVKWAEVLDNVDNFTERIDDTISSVRRIASDLRPQMLDDLGLVAACEWQAGEFERITKIQCSFNSDFAELDLGSDSNSAVYRIIQEALTNAARHSSANIVSINLKKQQDEIGISVADNGCGISKKNDPATRSLGLLGMRERSRLLGGRLDIVNGPSGGTIVELLIPDSRLDAEAIMSQ